MFGLAKVFAPLLVALCIGVAAIGHVPIIDDEANAIALALQGLEPVLQAGLGSEGHFHPPLGDLLQSAWFSLVTPQPIWLARLPALMWWLGLCALLPWSLAPLLDACERRHA